MTPPSSAKSPFTAIGEWAADCAPRLLAGLGIHGRPRTESTIRRLFARIDADLVDQVMGAWMWERTSTTDSQRVIALDGKTLRGASSAHAVTPHLVAALDHASGTVVGQVAVTAKSNEIPAVRDLLGSFDLTGTVVTIDAMHTQSPAAALITDAGGHYALTIKGNQPGLYAACRKLPWATVPAHATISTGHGRRHCRTIKTCAVPDWITFPGAAQIAQLRRTVTRPGSRSTETVYLITSADHHDADPATLSTWIQDHWGIENRLHWVRDVTFDEDRSQVRTGHAPQVMATIRNTVISILRLTGWANITQALRHHARHPEQTLNSLLTC